MSAFGRRDRLSLPLLRAAGAVAAALAACHACAGGPAIARPSPAIAPLLSPEAPPRFGDIAPSPLLSLFNAARGGGSGGSSLGPFANSKFEIAPAVEIAAAPSTAPNPPGAWPPANSEPPAPPPLSPTQSAIKSATERLVALSGQPNPLGAGDWRAARAAIAASLRGAWLRAGVGRQGWANPGRARRAGTARTRQRRRPHALRLHAAARDRRGPGPRRPRRSRDGHRLGGGDLRRAGDGRASRAVARISPLIAATPSVADPGAALAETAAAADPAQRLADFNPPQKGYRDLREEWKRLIDAPPGARGPAADLGVEPQPGEAPWRTKRPAAGRIHTASADAAFAFGSLARQRAAILANMEMWRWEPRDMGERRIEVNRSGVLPLALMEGDTRSSTARVIVGKAETPTPIFSNVMRYVLINPSWQVPDSIIKKEMMPKLGSLSRRGYEVKTVGGRLTVRQLPGEDNALGRIAFMFPNDHAVYLHDTPARELFDEESRALSHGCIRVEDPLSLAELVLGGETSKWAAPRIEAAIGGPERTVFLPRPLPIHIEYFTEFVDEFGELKERPDVYGLTHHRALYSRLPTIVAETTLLGNCQL